MVVEAADRDPRRTRALQMLHAGVAVVETSSLGEYVVGSQSGKGLYRVSGVGIPDGFEACTCDDFKERIARCKHIWVVVLWCEAGKASPTAPVNYPPVPRKRYRRVNQPAYDKAQTEEVRLFHVLLRELCASIPEPLPNPKGGRPAVPMRDQAFSAIQKCYTNFSFRRSNGFRAEATAKGQLDRTPYWAVGSRFLCRAEVTPELHTLLAQSAIPLMAFEKACAIDSTGLRTTLFHYYRKEKYEPQRENIWLKLHALVGTETHVIPVLEVNQGNSGDAPMFPVLLKRAVDAGFRFEEALADKAYNGRPNYNAAAELGIQAYIPFKKNSTGQSRRSAMFHRMYLFYRYHREEFDQHYRQRAQVEATFSALKAKLSETIVSRTLPSQLNEVLARCIAYNLTILIRQMFERGILPDFLKPAPKGAVIRLGLPAAPSNAAAPVDAHRNQPTLGLVDIRPARFTGTAADLSGFASDVQADDSPTGLSHRRDNLDADPT